MIEKLKRARFIERRSELMKLRIDELIKLLEAEDLKTRFVAEMVLRDKAGV